MSGVLNITRGRRQAAVRGTFYGTEGIGKSTLASQLPAPLVLDTEDGTNHLDVARVSIHDWKTLTLAMAELAVDAKGFKTIVIDSADWAERLLIEWLLKTSGGKKSIEEFGFGKGYVMLAEHFTRFLASADVLVSQGLNVVFVAHAMVKRTSPPDQTDGYDRYELKLTKQVSPLLREWCDLLLFCTYRTKLVEGSDGRLKATGGKERIMHAEHSAAWDAKNRFGLPAEMPMDIGQLAAALGGGKPAAAGWLERVNAATTVAELDAIGNDADQAESDGTLTPAKRKRLDDAIAARRDELEPREVVA